MSLVTFVKHQGRKKPRSDYPRQVNFDLGQVKSEVQWPGGQIKLASVSSPVSVRLINDNLQSEATGIPKLKTVRLANH